MPQPPFTLAHRFSSCRSLFCDCVVTSCGHRYCAGCVQGARDCPACGADIESLEPDEETQGAQEAGSSCGLQQSIPSIWIAPGDAVVGNPRLLPQRPAPRAASRLGIVLPKCCRVCYEASAKPPPLYCSPGGAVHRRSCWQPHAVGAGGARQLRPAGVALRSCIVTYFKPAAAGGILPHAAA